MWLKLADEDGAAPEGVTKPVVLPHQPVRAAASGDPRRRRLRQGDGARHELRRPRGRARASSSSTSASTAPCAPPTTSPPTARSAPPSAASTACTRRSCRSRSPASRPTATTTTSRWSTTSGNNVFHDPDGPAQLSRDRPAVHGRDPRPLRGAGLRRLADRQLLQADVGLRLLGAGLQELRLAEPHLHGARRERRPVRVPRRRLVVQPLPDPGGAAHRRPRRGPARARSRPAPAGATPTTCSPRAPSSSGCPTTSARRSRRSRPTRSSAARCRGASTTSSCTTSATSGSATWPRSPTGSATSTWRSAMTEAGS